MTLLDLNLLMTHWEPSDYYCIAMQQIALNALTRTLKFQQGEMVQFLAETGLDVELEKMASRGIFRLAPFW